MDGKEKIFLLTPNVAEEYEDIKAVMVGDGIKFTEVKLDSGDSFLLAFNKFPARASSLTHRFRCMVDSPVNLSEMNRKEFPKVELNSYDDYIGDELEKAKDIFIKRNEEEFVNKLIAIFEKDGWVCNREVIPDCCESWQKPYRVDLIVYKNEFGYIGIEAKHINMRNGNKFSAAFMQIVKYSKLTYFKGHKISQWAVAFDSNYELSHGTERADFMIFLRGFLSGFGIGLIKDCWGGSFNIYMPRKIIRIRGGCDDSETAL